MRLIRRGTLVVTAALAVAAAGNAQESFFQGQARIEAMRELETLVPIKERHDAAIMALTGVHGFGISLNKSTRHLDFLVLVEPNVPMPALPTTIDGIPVRVQREEMARPLEGGDGCMPCHTNQLPTPVAMGNSTFSELFCASCSLGFKACDLGTGNLVYVTNAHCSTDATGCEGTAPIGAGTRHRSTGDAGCALQTLIGQVAGHATPTCGINNVLDAAKIDSDNTLTSFMVRDIGVPSTVPGSVLPGDPVRKSGRTTGLTLGEVESVNHSVTVGPYCCGNVDFVSQIRVNATGGCSDPPCSWSRGGDSGSGLFTTGDPPQVAGLNFSGPASGLAGNSNPINPVLAGLNLSLDPCDCLGVCSGACCDVLAGTCTDDVFAENCQGAGQQFFHDEDCNALSAPCLPAGPNARMIVLLDRSGSMNKVRMTGNTRCLDALEQAKTDVTAFTAGFPNRRVAVWTFSGVSASNVTVGFVDQAAALAALNGLNGVACGGTTPLAEAICDVAGTFPGGLPQQDKLLSISSDGGENVSGGPCAGPASVAGPPPSGNYDPGSWQKNVYDTLLAQMVVNVRHWGAFASFTGNRFTGSSPVEAVDPETGLPRSNILSVSDLDFFDDLTTANVGLYRQMDDGPAPLVCIGCTPHAQAPFECTGSSTTVTLSGQGLSLDGPVVPTWTPPPGCTIAPGAEKLFQTTADCQGKGNFTFKLRVTLDADEDGDAEPGEPFSECDLLVTIQDTTPPTLAGVPPDLDLECDQPVPPPANVGAQDTCDGPIPVIFQERIIPLGCPDSLVRIRTWEATDGSGNSASATQIIRILDTTPPVPQGVPADATVECDSVPAPAPVGAVDNCDPAPGVVFAEARQDGTCPDDYKLTRSWTVTDRCGNSTVALQVLDVQDTTPPVARAALRPTVPRSPRPPVSICEAPTSRTFQVECSATDNCDAAPSLAAQLLVTNHDVDDLGTCVERLDRIDVECGEVVEIRLLSPPCPAKPPRSEVVASQVNAAGIKTLTGESVVLEVEAKDRCDNSDTDPFDATVDPPEPCEIEHQNGSCCPALMPPPPRSCPGPLC